MQGKHLYEYAIIRLIPRVEREEFINIGVILHCHPAKFLGVKFYVDPIRLSTFSSSVDVSLIIEYLEAIEDLCAGENRSSIAQLPIKERFRWITANRSSILQTSPVHLGLTADAAKTLDDLFEKMVL